jgi:hypothetical protein
MTWSVYALADPRAPEAVRYFGSTGVNPRKRWRDQISQTKHRAKKARALCPVYQWIKGLLDEGLEPTYAVLATDIKGKEEAVEIESAYIATFLDHGILNSPVVGYCLSGKPVGMKDRIHGAKKAAWKKDYSARCQSMVNRMAPENKTFFLLRTEQGYPYPRLDFAHPLNYAHYRSLKLKTPVGEGKTFHTKPEYLKATAPLREKWGYPRPDLAAQAPENYAHHYLLRRKGVKFSKLAELDPKDYL